MSRLLLAGMPEKSAEWASVGAAIVEPLKSEKQLGWVVDEEPPAPWFNWWQKRVWVLQRLFLGMVPSNLFLQADVTGAGGTAYMILYHPATGKLIVQNGTSIFSSADGGINWTNEATPATLTAIEHTGAIDSSRYIIGIDHAGPGMQALESVDGTTWNVIVIDGALAENVGAIGTGEYGSNDKIIVGGQSGTIRFASSILGAFQTPTTPPGVVSFCSAIRKVNAQWVVLFFNGATYVTNDDGDNWLATAQTPQTAVPAATGWRHMAAAPGSDYARLVAVGRIGGNAAIAYSDDQGATWNAATLVTNNLDLQLYAVYYLGADVWIASGTSLAGTAFYTIVSTDGGRNWYSVDIANLHAIAGAGHIADIVVDERRLWLIGVGNNVVRSLAMQSGVTP